MLKNHGHEIVLKHYKAIAFLSVTLIFGVMVEICNINYNIYII